MEDIITARPIHDPLIERSRELRGVSHQEVVSRVQCEWWVRTDDPVFRRARLEGVGSFNEDPQIVMSSTFRRHAISS